MNTKTNITLVCFDLGGVLIRICRSWNEACLAAGLPMRGEQWKSGDARDKRFDQLALELGTGRIDHETWAKKASEIVHGIYTPAEIGAMHEAFLICEYEGVTDTIDRIHTAGVQTAALSNTNSQHWATLVKYPAIAKLHFPMASHVLGLYKPDPAIYREFERRVNRRGNEILFFDDLPPNIEAAQNAGWNSVLIDPHKRTDLQIEAALQHHGVFAAEA